ncbi:MAG: hypothetical protein AAGB01_05555 [Cyanobacteria bacterium P01_F01_bin.42]
MTSSDPSPLEIQKRFAAVERRLSKLEASLGEIDRVVDPEGWIGESFEVLDQDLTELKVEVQNKMNAMDAKLDTILRHITGLTDTG